MVAGGGKRDRRGAASGDIPRLVAETSACHGQEIPLELIRESLAWRRTSVMGVAWFCNLAFVSIDMLMLGIMSNPGRWGCIARRIAS